MATDEGQAPEAPSAARIARDAAVAQAAGTLAYLAVCVLASVVVLKRDAIGRAWRRLFDTPDPPEVPAEALAELHRDIRRFETEGAA